LVDAGSRVHRPGHHEYLGAGERAAAQTGVTFERAEHRDGGRLEREITSGTALPASLAVCGSFGLDTAGYSIPYCPLVRER
jgi:hypothetical protein